MHLSTSDMQETSDTHTATTTTASGTRETLHGNNDDRLTETNSDIEWSSDEESDLEEEHDNTNDDDNFSDFDYLWHWHCINT